MLPRIKESERQKMLVNYLKDGSVPEGFYAIPMKDGVRIQFRRIKTKPNAQQIKAKIESYKKKITELEDKLTKMDD